MCTVKRLMKLPPVLLGAGLVAMNFAVPSAAWADVCATASLETYSASGFNCTIGDLQFSAFSGFPSFIGDNGVRTGNGLADILVTPQNVGGEKGFAFSNLNISFTSPGGQSNTNFLAFFTVNALAGLINDAEMSLGSHSFTNPGGVVGGLFGDVDSAIFGVSVFDSPTFTLNPNSTTFPGVATFRADTAVSANAGGVPGISSASVDGFTVLLSTEQVAAIPEPEIYAMMGLGLGLLGWVRRRKRIQAT